ncbi:MAG TPA: hypothetical protein VF979_03960 [Streptosporangiaceae bacterium]
MNQGGESGRDDYGLPPVDIEIPDDARELYRDVQAYHRELRALRRHQRSMRWRAPFRRSGIAIPLLAGCLVAALVAVMVSAVFTSNPYFTKPRPSGPPGAAKGTNSGSKSTKASNSSSGPSASPSTGVAGPVPTAGENKLPGKTIDVAGKRLALRNLVSTALAIVPAKCSCEAAVVDLLTQAGTAGVIIYLVGPRGSTASLEKLLAGASTSATKVTKVATDDRKVLSSAYKPVGLTVLFVDARGGVTVTTSLRRPFMFADRLRMLKTPG